MKDTDRCDCIVLAAGASRRMGRSKLYLPVGERTLIETTVAAAGAAGGRVIVVHRAADGALGELLGPKVELVLNPDPDRGMISSLREGLRRVSSSRFFFIPADLPFVDPQTYRAMLATSCEGPLIPTFRGRRGHPVLMRADLIPAIYALPENEPLRSLIERCGPTLLEVEDECILVDIDTADEYRDLVARFCPTCIPRAAE
ncbi:MAG TPA: nucleotidyltransferase family protein [Rectinemataceae bacterium]|nr:nucleotidyltransferase family protein [Rectinemataceae bacterium]